jgi:hypothetical protein
MGPRIGDPSGTEVGFRDIRRFSVVWLAGGFKSRTIGQGSDWFRPFHELFALCAGSSTESERLSFVPNLEQGARNGLRGPHSGV